MVGAAGIAGTGPLVPAGVCVPSRQEASLQLPCRLPLGAVRSLLTGAAFCPSVSFPAGAGALQRAERGSEGRGCGLLAGLLEQVGWGAVGCARWLAGGPWIKVCSST